MDKDTRILVGASEGWGSFRKTIELAPLYGNNFDRHEISLGKEWNAYASFIPFVPAYIARATPLLDLVYDYAGTGAAGMGSQRYALSARGGLSLRFGSMDNSEAIIRLRVGMGVAYNLLNFGKGIVPSGDVSANMAAQISAAYVYCLNQYLCVGPKIAVGGDASAGYTTVYGTLGFEINGKVGPQTRLVDEPVPVPPPVTGKYDPLVKKIIELQKEHQTDKEIITILRKEAKTFEVKIQKLIETLKQVESVKYLTMVRPQGMVLFQNDSKELAMLEQKFPLEPLAVWGKGNPTLDAVIRKVHVWVSAVKKKPKVKDKKGVDQPPYTIEITVRGFANETGEAKHNVELANGRAKVVVDYLTGSQNTRNHRGEALAALAGGVILKPITVISYNSSDDPKAEIRNVLLAGRDPLKMDENQKTALETDVQNPIWRMAFIEYKITKFTESDKKEITVDEFTRELGMEEEKK